MIVFVWTEIKICVYNRLRADVALILGVEKLTKEPRYVSIYLLFICSHGIRCLHRMSTLTSFDEVQLTFNNWLINHRERENTGDFRDPSAFLLHSHLVQRRYEQRVHSYISDSFRRGFTAVNRELKI